VRRLLARPRRRDPSRARARRVGSEGGALAPGGGAGTAGATPASAGVGTSGARASGHVATVNASAATTQSHATFPHRTRARKPRSMPHTSRERLRLHPVRGGRAPIRCYRPRPMAGLYDLMVLLDPNAPEERQDEILGDVRAMIEAEAVLVDEQDWGTRRLAFEIDHRPEAAYHLFQFESGTALLERLRHVLKITDGVLRHRIIRVKPGTPAAEAPGAEGGARRDGKSETQVAPRAAADAPAV
jgi:small subunit ribosomal protein S6